MFAFNELKALEALLNQGSANEEDKDYSDPAAAGAATLTPGHIGPQYSKNAKGGEEDEKKAKEKEEEPAIDLDKEAALYSGRFQPEYEFVYKQAVSCNDVYMQMSEKDCSSMSCEDLVMRINLPGTDGIAELNLDVQPTYVKLVSPTYYLALFLPHKVNMERSSAKWDAVTSTLIVTMPIVGRDLLSQPVE